MLRLALFFAALTGSAADLSGIWSGTMQVRNEKQDISFQFKQNGGTLAGKLYGDSVDLPISDGWVSGEAVKFFIKTEGYSGKTRFVYEGTLENGELRLTREREDSESKVSEEARKKTRQQIVLKRML
jgi:hypothetical protein